MSQKLVIVESPAKAKTIKKYLGSSYVVEASMGHIIDLPKSQLGVNVDNNYEPKYITIRGKGELLTKLKKAVKKSDKVYLATDPDREGEAISWHLANALKLQDENCRIEFNEITKNAVKNAIKNPRKINYNLVDAQQARRVLDRLVGYQLSPILWKKVKWGLSAGRVQSVTLKMICDREIEINDFVPKEYWTIECDLTKEKDRKIYKVKLATFKGKKIEIFTKDEADEINNKLVKNDFIVKDIKRTTKLKNPSPPFTTSTLQQDAYKKLNYGTKRTMSIAQQLYEGVDVKGHGTVGLITYMRTDSVRISNDAQNEAIEFIKMSYGDKYVPPTKRFYKGKKDAQDAHEAIRPSNVNIKPEDVKGSLKDEQYKLYNLIWNRYVASQMASCEMDLTSVEIANGDYILRISGSKIKFDGFVKIYINGDDEDGPNLNFDFEIGEKLNLKKIDSLQHFTQPPARYTEGSMVKSLEENGIGRPSTYAPTITTLLNRRYIEKVKKNLEPTELGIIVNKIMSEYFEDIVNVEFTAQMENKLDEIEEGKEEWQLVIDDYYKPFIEAVNTAEKEISKITIEDEVSDVLCEKCGRNMVIKKGRYGGFLACPGYPECENTKPLVETLDVKCPKCDGEIQAKRSKKGNKFYGCSNYPNCDFVSWFEPTNDKCEKCGSYMVKKYNKTKGNFLECSNSECKERKYTEKDDNKAE